MSASRKKLIDILLHDLKGKGNFSQVLSTVGPATKIINHVPNKVTNFEYKVPKNICVLRGKDAIKQQVLPASGALAVFDELSSYMFMLNDKNTRAGVSVLLTVDVLKDIHAGDTVNVEVVNDKIGKNIGFCSMYMKNDTGDVLIRGTHIKYMPSTWLLELLMSPMILPWMLNLYAYFGYMYKKPSVNSPADEDNNVYDRLNLQEAPTVSTSGSKDDSISTSNNNSSALFKAHMLVTNSLKNMLGILHGGAICLSIEETSRLYQRNQVKEKKISPASAKHVKSMSIHYLNAVGSGLIETVIYKNQDSNRADDHHIDSCNKARGVVQSQKGKVYVQYELTYTN